MASKYNQHTTHMTCRECKETKPLDEMKKSGSYGKFPFQDICKKCHSIYTYHHQMVKKLQTASHLYSQCDNDDCLFIFKRVLKKSTRTHCPKCNLPILELDDEKIT